MNTFTTPSGPTPHTVGVLLVDGFNIAYRAYYANDNLTNAKGFPTGAIHGFLKTINMLMKKYPGFVPIITFDPLNLDTEVLPTGVRRPTLNTVAKLDDRPSRSTLSPEYKTTRSVMPDELRQQFLPLMVILEAKGYTLLQGTEHAEADDLIAALATQAKTLNIPCVIASGDKDLFAMVQDPLCKVFNPNTNSELDEAAVHAKFGVKPNQILDFLALKGDAVDNIKGVEKCGEVTAAKWLNKYGNLNTIMANAHNINGVVGDNLRKALNYLPTARALTDLRIDLPVDLVKCATLKQQDTYTLRMMYEALHMRSALTALEANATPAPM